MSLYFRVFQWFLCLSVFVVYLTQTHLKGTQKYTEGTEKHGRDVSCIFLWQYKPNNLQLCFSCNFLHERWDTWKWWFHRIIHSSSKETIGVIDHVKESAVNRINSPSLRIGRFHGFPYFLFQRYKISMILFCLYCCLSPYCVDVGCLELVSRIEISKGVWFSIQFCNTEEIINYDSFCVGNL